MAGRDERAAKRARQAEIDRQIQQAASARRARAAQEYLKHTGAKRIDEGLDRGDPPQDLEFVSEMFGLLGGLNEKKIEKLSDSKLKALDQTTKNLMKNPRLSGRDKRRVKQVAGKTQKEGEKRGIFGNCLSVLVILVGAAGAAGWGIFEGVSRLLS